MGSPRAGDFYSHTVSAEGPQSIKTQQKQKAFIKTNFGRKKKKDLSIGRSWEHRNTAKRCSFSNVLSGFSTNAAWYFWLNTSIGQRAHRKCLASLGRLLDQTPLYHVALDQSVQSFITFSRRFNVALHHCPVVGKNTAMCETNLVPKPVKAQWECLYRQQKP